MSRRFHYGETAFGRLAGIMRRVLVIKQGPVWTKVCLGFSGHCTAVYSRVRTDTLLPRPSTGGCWNE